MSDLKQIVYLRQTSSLCPWIECEAGDIGAVAFVRRAQPDAADSAKVADKLDADRYRWLRERDTAIEGIGFTSYIPEMGHDGSNLDWAIDAARGATKEVGEAGNG